jgi:hypothetical protein
MANHKHNHIHFHISLSSDTIALVLTFFPRLSHHCVGSEKYSFQAFSISGYEFAAGYWPVKASSHWTLKFQQKASRENNKE